MKGWIGLCEENPSVTEAALIMLVLIVALDFLLKLPIMMVKVYRKIQLTIIERNLKRNQLGMQELEMKKLWFFFRKDEEERQRREERQMRHDQEEQENEGRQDGRVGQVGHVGQVGEPRVQGPAGSLAEASAIEMVETQTRRDDWHLEGEDPRSPIMEPKKPKKPKRVFVNESFI